MKQSNVVAILIFLLLISKSLCAQQTQVIAHRGYWKTKGAAPNSLIALLKADEINCYGAEFDVYLTADDELVVNHDKKYKGVVFEEASCSVTTSIELDNGESLPSLQQYLKLAKLLDIKLILEFKVNKLSEERQTLGIQKILEMVREYVLEERMEYIAFSLYATKEFVRLAPKGTPVYYLKGNLSPKELKEIGCAGADYSQKILEQHPTWIKECHDLGLKVNVWTVNDEENMRKFINVGVDFITTDEPLMF